jgi:hypothetical protein
MRSVKQNQLLAAAFGLAIIFTLSCGQHSWDEIFGDQSSNSGGSEQAENSSSSFASSSSSLRQSSGSNEQQNSEDDELGGGIDPSTITASTPASITNSQGTVIVGPLLKTQWGKGSPFDPFNTRPDGSHVWIGCVVVALAQVLNYHKYPKQYFDWDNMLDTYRNVNLTEQQRNAILALLYNIGNYSYGFRYDDHYWFERLDRKHYDAATWAAMIREQLDSGLPVYAVGYANIYQTGHAFVIDRYDDKGKFHINWGWGGIADGYYPLDSLTPNGRSLEEGFHDRGFIDINFRPILDIPFEDYLVLSEFSPVKTSVQKNEQFKVSIKLTNVAYEAPSIYYGVALIDNDGNIVEVIEYMLNTSAINPGKEYSTYLMCKIPNTVLSGKYRLSIVISDRDDEDERWYVVTKSINNTPTAIDFTVM